MKIIISPKAIKQFKNISKVDQMALSIKIFSLPTIKKQKRLKNLKNIFRVRVGNYRIVYRKTKNEIYIVTIGHRQDVYRAIKGLFK